ncbi:Lrp/AsnC family transcriptional regulator [Paraconexibacter algicola]|uniref:HTH asnC-type domain-containing protein n=1 Tax=Paraconexibacter algicola TaxID=2133960 RepID=A0A2T4UL57_9ACTN|nr:Lrp/AsnC family transcriptional regulator [Paraconexibacter algicola]PTL59950.1 hypothetical protein C7Y72_09985 [Paraconexibacter algicola]
MTLDSTRDPPTVDDLDRALVSRLREDGRATNRGLARSLDVTERTVATRLRRLSDAGLVRVVAVTDMEAFGLTALAFVLIRVAGRRADAVAEDLVGLDEAIGLATVTGSEDLVAIVLCPSHARLADVLAEGIAVIDGVTSLHCELAAKVLRFDSQYGRITPQPRSGSSLLRAARSPHDDLDIEIVLALQADSRASNRSIAASLDVSEATVRARVSRLVDNGTLRIQAVCDIESFGITAFGFLGVRAEPGQVEPVGRSLLRFDELGLVARSIGRYDFIAILATTSRERALRTVQREIAGLEAVATVDFHEGSTAVKHEFTWANFGTG